MRRKLTDVLLEVMLVLDCVLLMKSVYATSQSGIVLTFEQTNSKDRYSKSLEVRAADFRDMVRRYYGDETKVYDDYKAAAAEVKRLNAAEREKQE